MAKRSDGQFERRDRDTYDTPFGCVPPLIPHLPRACYFIEPCAGRGDLVDHLEKFGHTCLGAFDIEPRRADIRRGSAFRIQVCGPRLNTFFITNPPWTRGTMHPMIRHLANLLPTWLLFDADWFHTAQAIPFLPFLHKYVSIGRVKWIEESDHVGKDNCAWYFFDARYQSRHVEAYGPTA